MLTIQERLRDLRDDSGLNLEQLSEATGLSKSALGNYESNEFKAISHYAIIKLAKFYGVTTDYLLGLSETKKHSTDDINSLKLSDELIDILQQEKINVPLFCELVVHKDFPKLLADIEIYVNRFATKMIGFLNSYEMPKAKAPDTKVQHEATRTAAEQCIVLLKNDEGILPLQHSARIAVIGDFAAHPRYQGAGSSMVNALQIDETLDLLTNYSHRISLRPRL